MAYNNGGRPTSGWSWGEEMPTEENQFSYSGPYRYYFEGVFRESFPTYALRVETANKDRTTVFYFFAGNFCKLIVEVTSDSYRNNHTFEEACKKAGIPHLRFYHDHHGWWNTRSYVVARVRSALNG